ncbi:MAG TPA: amidohydrolase family protein [Gemmatimonadota bacterium]|nr:amidohydrolase family protein [Gemmatimonadota bacterium]
MDAEGGAATALVGATILDGTGGPAIDDGVLLFSSDTIECVGSHASCPVPDGAEIHDVTGKYLTPGLIDAHVHFSQTGWLDGRPDGLDLRERYPYEELVADLRSNPGRFYASYLCAGVTGVFDVGGFRWTIDMARTTADDPAAPHIRAAGPLISHAGLEILSTESDGGQFIMLTSAEAGRAGVRELAGLGADAVKVWYLMPPDSIWDEIEDRFRAVADEARSVGLPLIVHATELRAARVAVDAGAFMLVHSVDDEPVDEEFLALMKERGTIYAPTLLVGRNWGRAVVAAVTGDTVPEWDDPLGCVDPWTEEKLRAAPELQELVSDEGITPEMIAAGRERSARGLEVMTANLRRVHAAGIPIVLATDAGNPLTLHGVSVHEELDAMEAAGIPPQDLLVMATRNGAQALRRPDLGTLEAGRVADILILSEDPRQSATAFRALDAVIHRGVWTDPD